tara:strand:+ start:325 stop:699 length:375 start_codon:yes stop_codon:yes gene_type:complete
MNQVDQLKQAIENIASKQHVISAEAKQAQEKFDQSSTTAKETSKPKQLSVAMENFNESVTILMKVFAKSRFDEVMGMVANPAKLIVLNFFVAFFRGVGFICGALTVLYMLYSIFGELLLSALLF